MALSVQTGASRMVAIGKSQTLPARTKTSFLTLNGHWRVSFAVLHNRAVNGRLVQTRGGLMRRRDFIKVIAGQRPRARAQQLEGMRRIGVLMSLEENDPEGKTELSLFTKGLAESGWIDGRNLQMEVRWGGGDLCAAVAVLMPVSAPIEALA
jgi:hypothetical protein